MISNSYRKLNQELHEKPHYGTSGVKFAPQVHALAISLQTQDILDYGCGKSTLADNLPFKIKQYDPAIPKYDKKPEPADLVVCTDVLEHIEPEHLEAVLDDLQRLVLKRGFFTIATRPAQRTLSDGRNAHLIQENGLWWLGKLWDRFQIIGLQNMNDLEFIVIVGKK
jgi:hypothetical protein